MFLSDLPSRGTLLAPAPGSVISRLPTTYVCKHDTDPPESQVVKTDQTNILIRSLQLKQAKKTSKPSEPKGKRSAESAAGGPAKRTQIENQPNADAPSCSDSEPTFTAAQLMTKSKKEMEDWLKGKGLKVTGKKEELIRRVMEHQASHRNPAARPFNRRQ